ncbi:hypothetical protein [Methylobacterium sp. WL9]|uniref:hypothetical protein n=1 Tax=Methylobacterium sp. WL9 TaxID=2603898 RepID=UPI00165063CC|nr:hypothetical protein [Methylobacterium sp. WL9]
MLDSVHLQNFDESLFRGHPHGALSQPGCAKSLTVVRNLGRRRIVVAARPKLGEDVQDPSPLAQAETIRDQQGRATKISFFCFFHSGK